MDSIEDNTVFDVAAAPSTGMPRENLVDTATTFLLNPRARGLSVSQQRAFFQKKGLTPVEIDMAFQRSMLVGSYNQQNGNFYQAMPSIQGFTWTQAISRTTMGLAMMSSAAYAVYWVWKTYIEPSMGPTRLERQVDQILNTMREENEQRRLQDKERADQLLKLAQSIMELRQEIASLKKMSLGRSQFAMTPGDASLPSWQLKPICQENS